MSINTTVDEEKVRHNMNKNGVVYEHELDSESLNMLKCTSQIKIFKYMDSYDGHDKQSIVVNYNIFSKMLALQPLKDEVYIPVPTFITKDALHQIWTKTSPNIIHVLAQHIKICNFLEWDCDNILHNLHVTLAMVISYNTDVTNNQLVTIHDSDIRKLDLSCIGFRQLYYLRLQYFGSPSLSSSFSSYNSSYDKTVGASVKPFTNIVTGSSGSLIDNEHKDTSVDKSYDRNIFINKPYNKDNNSEMLELQRYWWCIGLDPTVVIQPVPIELDLGKETIDQILLYAELPTYKPIMWLHAKPRIGITYKRGSEPKPGFWCSTYFYNDIVNHNVMYSTIGKTITRIIGRGSNIGGCVIDDNNNSSIDDDNSELYNIFSVMNSHLDDNNNNTSLNSYRTLCLEYNYVMGNYCQRMEPVLSALYTKLVLCWCNLYIAGIFDPNLYMMRFPKPQKVVVYRDIISSYADMLIKRSTDELKEFICVPMPPCYNESKRLLQRSHEYTSNIHGTLNNTISNRSSMFMTKLISGITLKLKTDDELKTLCEQYSILCVPYHRQDTITILSKYIS